MGVRDAYRFDIFLLGFFAISSLQIHKLKVCNPSQWLDLGFDPFQAHTGQFEGVRDAYIKMAVLKLKGP